MEAPKGESPPQSPEGQERVGQKWNYKLLYHSATYASKELETNFSRKSEKIPVNSEDERDAELLKRVEDVFNSLGNEGWELVASRRYAYGTLNIFKRPTPSK